MIITVYADRSFTFITKTSPAARLILKEAKLNKGSGTPNKDKIGKLTSAQIRQIAEAKMTDLNTTCIDSAIRTISGTARSMGVEIID